VAATRGGWAVLELMLAEGEVRRKGQKDGVSRMTEHATGRDEVLAGCQSLVHNPPRAHWRP